MPSSRKRQMDSAGGAPGSRSPGRRAPVRRSVGHAALPCSTWPVAARMIDVLVGVGAGELGDQPALVQHEHAVGHAQHLGQLGGDHQHGDALGDQLGEQPVHLGLGADVDAAGRLVDDQQRRAGARATWPARPSAGCRPRASTPGWTGGRTSAAAGRPTSARELALGAARDEPEPLQPAAARPGRRCGRSTGPSPGPAGGGPRARSPMPAAIAALGEPRPERGRRRPDRAGVAPVDAEDRPGHLAAAGADQPGQGDDLAARGPSNETSVNTPSRVSRSTASTILPGAPRPSGTARRGRGRPSTRMMDCRWSSRPIGPGRARTRRRA